MPNAAYLAQVKDPHRGTVTDCDLHYVGRSRCDPDLLEAADIMDHELVVVLDVNNGARLKTYTIQGELVGLDSQSRSTGPRRGWCTAATRSSSSPTPATASGNVIDHRPTVVHVDGSNEIVAIEARVSALP